MQSKMPNFQDISLFDQQDFITEEQWKSKAEAEIQTSIEDLLFETNEQIKLKPLYTKEDIEGLQHLDDKPGLPQVGS